MRTLDGLDLYARVEALVDPPSDGDRAIVLDIARLAREVLPPDRGAELEAKGELPAKELAALLRGGVARALTPRDHGGALDWSRANRICSHLAAHDLDLTLCLGGAVLGSLPVLVCGGPRHRAAYFDALGRGQLGGLGLTEWAHGSDLLAGDTIASPVDASGAPASLDVATHFRLDGNKAPINNGNGACIVVLARTGEAGDAFAHALFLLERGSPGMHEHPRFAPLGFRNMDLSGVALRGAIVPRSAMMGGAGEGFVHARRALEISRGGVASMALGPAATALALAHAHAHERLLYGGPIERLGGVRSILARSFARLVASTALARRAARSIAHFAVPARALSCAAKLACPALLEESIAECGSVLGARSLMNDLPFARLRRGAPVLAIFDGSSQLQLDELWRHAATWRERGTLSPERALEILSLLTTAAPSFDPHADGAGELASTTPPAMLHALDLRAPALGLAPFAAAAERIAEIAGRARGTAQSTQFGISQAAAHLYVVASLAEAHAMSIDPGSRAALEAALSLTMAECAAPLASALIELARVGTSDANLSDEASAILAHAARTPAARDATYAALSSLASHD